MNMHKQTYCHKSAHCFLKIYLLMNKMNGYDNPEEHKIQTVKI